MGMFEVYISLVSHIHIKLRHTRTIRMLLITTACLLHWSAIRQLKSGIRARRCVRIRQQVHYAKPAQAANC